MCKVEPKALLAVPISLEQGECVDDHAHMANEFILCTSGKGYHTGNIGRTPYTRNTLCFFARAQTHSHQALSASTLLSVRFRDEALMSKSKIDKDASTRLEFFKRQAYLGKHDISVPHEPFKRIQALFREAVQEEEGKRSGYENMLKGYALQLLVLLSREKNLALSESSPFVSHRITSVLSVIDRDPAAEMTVAQAAEMANLSRSHFHALFRNVAGMTLIEYVTRLRIGLARRLLANTTTPVIDICYDCGFSSVSRFYTAFGKIVGTSPKAYREKNKISED